MEQETKTCKCCGRTLTISNFKKGRWGYVSVCNECDKRHREEKRQEKIKEKEKWLENARAESRQLLLSDFTPRELMQELQRRGYEGTLTYTEVHTIDLSIL